MSALCISGMALVLGLYSDRKVPARWPLGITLNAYISVLSAISKYTLAGISFPSYLKIIISANIVPIVPVDEALGQLRWLYFASGPKSLIDFELFDDASRGPWGALALILNTKAKSVRTGKLTGPSNTNQRSGL
jgi:hypothetical protein